MSRPAEDFQGSEITESADKHELILDWPVTPIPNGDSRKADEIPGIIGEAAARTLGQLGPEKTSEPETLSEGQLEFARRYGVRYEEFEEKIISIQDDVVSHRPTNENIGHYFGATVSGSRNKPDQKYNLGLKELTKEGYEDLCRKYNPAASVDNAQPEKVVDKPTSHGDMTQSGKIFLPNPYRKGSQRPMTDDFWDPKSAAANDRLSRY